MNIICWWSGGVTSAVACHLAIKQFGTANCRIIFLDTRNEHHDTYRFKDDCSQWYGLPIESLASEKYVSVQDTWYRHKSLNTATGAICSYMLKRRVREAWEKENDFKHQVFGFEFDNREKRRAKALLMNHPQTKPLFPLIDAKIDKPGAMKIVSDVGIVVPEAYKMGFRNNNCLTTGCVQGGIGYWKKIQHEYPNKFKAMAKVEHDLTALKGQPVTMLKDQSNQAKESGVQLVFLVPHPDYPQHKSIDDMKGRPIEPLNECMGLCGVNELLEQNQTYKELNYAVEE